MPRTLVTQLNITKPTNRTIELKEKKRKECTKRYRDTHKEEIKDYENKHKLKAKAYHKNHYKEHKPEIQAKRKEHYEKNRERILQQQKAYRATKREQIRERDKIYRNKFKKEIKIKDKIRKRKLKLRQVEERAKKVISAESSHQVIGHPPSFSEVHTKIQKTPPIEVQKEKPNRYTFFCPPNPMLYKNESPDLFTFSNEPKNPYDEANYLALKHIPMCMLSEEEKFFVESFLVPKF